nr:hypothetical protein [Tanacetum cinerariifolium]
MDKENPWGKEGTTKDVDLHLYRSMIGSLMYLTASRPDIMFVVEHVIGGFFKGEHNTDFHHMVDFLEESPLRIETTEEGTKILPTVDGIVRTVSESSLRHEPASLQRDVSQREAYPTDSGFIADQDRATMAKLKKVEILKLKERVKVLEDREGIAATRSRDDAPIKGRSIDEGEATTERISDDTEEMATVLTSMDAVTVLVGGIDDVPTGSGSIPTGSGSIPTAGPPAADIPTGNDVVPTVKEQQEREDKRMSEQIARDADVARIHAVEELQSMIDNLDRNNETITKYPQEYQQFAAELPLERRIELISDLVKYQENYAKIYMFQSQPRKPWTKKQKRDYYMTVIKNNLGWKVKDFKGMTFEEVEAKFNLVYKQMKDFIPIGSKEEAERYKRKGIRSDQESSKKLKSSEDFVKEAKSTAEIPEEKIKEMMQLIPIEEVYVEALQVKHPIIVWKHLDRDDLNQLWDLVKEYLSIRPALSDKEMELWVELKRLYEPDSEDQLWAQTQNFMHAPVEWKLYDLCGVHQVTAKDKEIFMLVEKDYPLRKGLALVMICYKLQVENFSQMANDLVLKIYKITNSLRQQGD